MSYKMIGQPKTRVLTLGLAKEFSSMTPCPHDRPLNATRSAVIRRAFELGKFRTAEWASAYCEQTKQKYRINGKHTSTVLASMNGAFPKDISIIVEEYHCETMEDVAALYATFDTRSSVRSTGDINTIYAAAVPELADVKNRFINLTVVGVAYATWEDGYTQHAADERAALILTHGEFCLWISDLMTGFSNAAFSHIQRCPVVAAMYKTWNKSKSAATEFWKEVRDESGAKPECATRKVAKFLCTSRLVKKKSSNYRSVGNRETFVKCIHGWNAWRSGESTALQYFSGAKTPAAK